MSSANPRGVFRIIGGAETANLVVETAGSMRTQVQDVHALTVQRAHADGHQEGYALAKAEAAREQVQLRETIAHLAESLPQAWEGELGILEESLRAVAIDLAFEIAECLLRQPVHSEQVVRGAVSEALALPLMEGDVALHCHPADAAVLGQSPPTAGRGRLSIVPDPGLRPGDAALATAENGDLEAHLSRRLSVLRERLEALALTTAESDLEPDTGMIR